DFKDFLIRQNTFHLPQSITPHFNIDRPLFLGKGGYGVVGHLNSLRSSPFPDIALKKFDGAFLKPKTAQRCFRELQLLSRIQHENIVNFLFAFTPDSSHESLQNVYLLTEYAGEDLDKLIQKETLARHSYDLKDFKPMLIQLLNAIQFLNSAKVIHRDLKPQNIAIKSNGKLTLLDFGLARVIDTQRDMTSNPGTVYYRAIECINEYESRYDERADIWSIGAILCEMITGSILFESKHPLVKAISICGPMGEKVLSKINNMEMREYLEKKSNACTRMNFIDHFEKYGRSWMKKDVRREKENLRSFIDLTLQFDRNRRMTVNQALEHPFLQEKGRLPFWSCIPLSSRIDQSDIYQSSSAVPSEVDVFSEEDEIMFESIEAEINYWKERIWEHLSRIPNPF
ncbi:hypothetical protein PENTCL1PPCAC_21808, partial [Pristionchus entomophagus]